MIEEDEVNISESISGPRNDRLNTGDSITKTVDNGTQGSASMFIKNELENYEIEDSQHRIKE